MWFRNDLRLDDNPALNTAIKQGASRALFVISAKQWQIHNVAPIKVDFIERNVNRLGHELAQIGITLDVLHTDTFEQTAPTLLAYCQQHNIGAVYANSEPEWNEQQRDLSVISAGVNLILSHADCLLPPKSVLTQSQTMFKVFTPFKRACLQIVNQDVQRVMPQALVSTNMKPVEYADVDFKVEKVCSSRWPVSTEKIQAKLDYFVSNQVQTYHQQRDIPSIKATSGLSAYLAIGAISVKRCFSSLYFYNPECIELGNSGESTWLSELIWRDFYRHLLVQMPRLSKNKNFKVEYDNLSWPNRTDHFVAWCDGKTGYPIIDAAMRQLHAIGWMHNRLRMIVASFLTKHLLVDWRLGEAYFMRHLIDGDLASNNGGWQWAASTGADASPYFRIFNPVTQSKRFDPNGDFIRKYLPELRNVPDKHIHAPHDYLTKQGQANRYWPPIIDLAEGRKIALEFYKV